MGDYAIVSHMDDVFPRGKKKSFVRRRANRIVAGLVLLSVVVAVTTVVNTSSALSKRRFDRQARDGQSVADKLSEQARDYGDADSSESATEDWPDLAKALKILNNNDDDDDSNGEVDYPDDEVDYPDDEVDYPDDEASDDTDAGSDTDGVGDGDSDDSEDFEDAANDGVYDGDSDDSGDFNDEANDGVYDGDSDDSGDFNDEADDGVYDGDSDASNVGDSDDDNFANMGDDWNQDVSDNEDLIAPGTTASPGTDDTEDGGQDQANSFEDADELLGDWLNAISNGEFDAGDSNEDLDVDSTASTSSSTTEAWIPESGGHTLNWWDEDMNTAKPSSPAFESASTVESTTLAPPTCADTSFMLSEKCNQPVDAPDTALTYDDVRNSIRSEFIVQAWRGCNYGDECVFDDDLLHEAGTLGTNWLNGSGHAKVCPWTNCLDAIDISADFCIQDSAWVANASTLLCSLDFAVDGRYCLKNIITLLGRDLADLQEVDKNLTRASCRGASDCSDGYCWMAYSDMYDVMEACSNQSVQLRKYSPWSWYTKDEQGIINACGLNTTTFFFFNIRDKGMIAGVVLACVVITIVVSVLGFALWKKLYRNPRYHREKIEYSEVTGLMTGMEEED